MTYDPDCARRDRPLAVGIFFLALAVYVLTYTGAFKSNDERALFSGTDSFIKRGVFTADQIYWDYTGVGILTSSGEMVPNYEPAPMVLAIPFYLWGRALGAAVQGTIFLGALAAAASVALLYLCLLELGYRRRTATLGAFVFAFATQIWPYSRTLFREPLTVLAYLVAFYALLRYRPPAPRRLIWPVLLGTAMGMAFSIKQISIALAPALLLLVFVYEWQRGGSWRERVAPALAAGIPLAVCLLLGQLYHITTLSGVTTWARNIVDSGTNPQLSTLEPFRLLRGFLGITISPYKGVFWYSPVLLLGLIGTWPFLRRHLWEGLACWLAIGAHIVGYSRYLYWSGGVAWGSRYMLVIIPFLVLLSAPVFAWLLREGLPPLADLSFVGARLRGLAGHQRGPASRLPVPQPGRPARVQVPQPGGQAVNLALSSEGDITDPRPATVRVPPQGGQAVNLALPSEPDLPNRRPAGIFVIAGTVGVVLLMTLSLAIQVLGISIDLRTYEVNEFLLGQSKIWGGIGEAIDTLYLVPAYSPVFGHLRLLLSGQQPLDFAWIQLRPEGKSALVPAGLGLSLLAVAVSVAVFLWLWRRPQKARVAGTGMSLAMVACCSALLLVYRQGDARFDAYNVDHFLRPMDTALNSALQTGQVTCCRAGAVSTPSCTGVLIVPDPVLTDYYLNYFTPRMPWYGIDPKPVDARLLDQLMLQYPDLWLARDRNAETDDQEDRRGTERYLADHAYKLDEQRFDDWARLVRYSAAGTVAEDLAPQQVLGDMLLDRATVGLARRGPAPACASGQAASAAQALQDGKVQAQAGDVMQLGLHWKAQTKPAANYTVFVQLLDGGGQVKAQSDRTPGDGLYPTGALQAGQVITDNLALRLNVPPGNYRLIAGMYRNDLPNLPRLTGPAGDAVTLAEVNVN